jgi:hypothetical protein
MKPTYRPGNFTILSLLIISLSAFLYLLTATIYYQLNNNIVPSGDPFSYTISLFKLLDYSRDNYWGGVFSGVFNQQWYWLYKLPVAILSPFLAKEPHILCFVNYLFMAIGTISFGRMALRLGLNLNTTLLLTLSLWLYPGIYGYRTTFSLFTLMLETSFYWILIAFASHLIIYLLDPGSRKNALIAGIFGGLAVWGRGNSLPYVLIILLMPTILILFRWIKNPAINRNYIGSMMSFAVPFVIMTAWYYSVTYEQLRIYYWDWAQGTACEEDQATGFFSNPEEVLTGIKIIATNFPGVIFTRYPDHISSIASSMIMHLIVAISLMSALRKWKGKSSRKNRLLLSSSLVGAVLYFGNMLMMMLILAPSLGSGEEFIYHPFLMMPAGLVFSMLTPLTALVSVKIVKKGIAKPLAIPVISISILLYGFYFSKTLTPIDASPDVAKPNDVSNFAVNLEKIIGDNNLTILWYGQAYNRFILDYYRIKNGIPEGNYYASREEISLLTTSYTSECAENIPIEDFRKLLRKLMLKSDYIIIPEEIRNFQFMMGQPGLANRREELAKFLNSSDSPKYAVKMILHDYYGTRLLLLQRLKFGKNPEGLDLLQLPYGAKNSGKAHLYPNAPHDIFREVVPINQFGPRMLSNSYSDSFWEVNGIYPHVIQAEFLGRRKVVAYALKTGVYLPESITRMPTDWNLEGSVDGKKWTKIDSRSGQTQWEKDSAVTFHIQTPAGYSYYRFIFQKGGHKRLIRINEIHFYETNSAGKMQEIDTLEYEWDE